MDLHVRVMGSVAKTADQKAPGREFYRVEDSMSSPDQMREAGCLGQGLLGTDLHAEVPRVCSQDMVPGGPGRGRPRERSWSSVW